MHAQRFGGLGYPVQNALLFKKHKRFEQTAYNLIQCNKLRREHGEAVQRCPIKCDGVQWKPFLEDNIHRKWRFFCPRIAWIPLVKNISKHPVCEVQFDFAGGLQQTKKSNRPAAAAALTAASLSHNRPARSRCSFYR